mmetsp:Transcript_1102/g.1460  ORF Transcript_1102/g.1460 Transcript_1102/m.1460 type:complete len:167 (-) Transcript_1102:342-842(-)
MMAQPVYAPPAQNAGVVVVGGQGGYMTTQAGNVVVVNGQTGEEPGSSSETNAMALLCLGFFFWFPWLIGFFLHYKSKHKKVRTLAWINFGFFWGVLIIVIIVVATGKEWTYCAKEGQVCVCPMGEIRYGVNDRWHERPLANATCNSKTFGNPNFWDFVKHCECRTK